MFDKVLAKLKATKEKGLNFSLNGQKFSFENSIIRQKLSKAPSFDLSKLTNTFKTKSFSLEKVTSRFIRSNITLYLQTYALNVARSINRRTCVGFLMSSAAFYVAYEYNPWMTAIKMHYQNNEFNQKLINGLTFLNNMHFYPSPVCFGSLFQAIMNSSPHDTAVRFVREPIRLSDGGQITLDWALPSKEMNCAGTHLHGKFYPYEPGSNNKILFVIHGLTGGSETNYIQTLVDGARKSGYRVVVLNHRGVNQQLLTPLPYHGGRLEDVEIALNHVKAKYPKAPILAVGTSFGGNQLIRYMGETGEKSNIVGGVLLSAPFDLDVCTDYLENTVYEDFFIKSYLEKCFLPHYDMFSRLQESHGINLEDILKVKKLRDFHSLLTVKVYDHKNVREYFETSKVSSAQIENVKSPLLVLHAKDDPIATHKSVPVQELRNNPNIIVAETNRGSHLCWFSGFRPKRVSSIFLYSDLNYL